MICMTKCRAGSATFDETSVASHWLQVVNRSEILQIYCQTLLPAGLLPVVLTSCNKSASDKLHSLILTHLTS